MVDPNIARSSLRLGLLLAVCLGLLPLGRLGQSDATFVIWVSALALLAIVLLVARAARRDGTMTWGYGCVTAVLVPVALVAMMFASVPPLRAAQISGAFLGLALLGMWAPFAEPWIRTVIFTLLAVLYLGWLAHGLLLCDWSGCAPTQWNTQLRVAQQAAALHGDDAVLADILALPEAHDCTALSGDVRVMFDFVAPDGDTLTVALESWRPRTSADVRTSTTVAPLPPADLRPAVVQVRIPPNTALATARQVGVPFLQPYGDRCAVVMRLDPAPAIPGTSAAPVAWSILFLGSRGDNVDSLEVWIDARDGSILGSEQQ